MAKKAKVHQGIHILTKKRLNNQSIQIRVRSPLNGSWPFVFSTPGASRFMVEQKTAEIERLRALFSEEQGLGFAVLIGSRARGDAGPSSDWDIALKWDSSDLRYLDQLAADEKLRMKIATSLNTSAENIDLIDAASAKLAMRALIGDEGLVLTDPDALPWLYYLQRTWRELEEYYWDDLYVVEAIRAI